jgi:anti-sigma B factor antagonist
MGIPDTNATTATNDVICLRTFHAERPASNVPVVEVSIARTSMLGLPSDREGGECEMRIEGAFDAHTAGGLEAAIEAFVANHPRRVIIDLERVSLMDSVGVGVIVSLWKRIKAQGGSVVVVHAHDQPLTVLRVLKLETAFGML